MQRWARSVERGSGGFESWRDDTSGAIEDRGEEEPGEVDVVVVIIHESDVLPACDVHQRLSLCPDAAGAVVAKYEVFNAGASNLLGNGGG